MTSCDDLTLERKSKNRKLIGLLAQRVETEIRFLDMAGACRTLGQVHEGMLVDGRSG